VQDSPALRLIHRDSLEHILGKPLFSSACDFFPNILFYQAMILTKRRVQMGKFQKRESYSTTLKTYRAVSFDLSTTIYTLMMARDTPVVDERIIQQVIGRL